MPEQKTEILVPCVSCGCESEIATADDADLCWPCAVAFHTAEYDALKSRFIELLNRDYPNANIEDALDSLRPLPEKPEIPSEIIDGIKELQHWQTEQPFHQWTHGQFSEWQNQKAVLLEKFWRITKKAALLGRKVGK